MFLLREIPTLKGDWEKVRWSCKFLFFSLAISSGILPSTSFDISLALCLAYLLALSMTLWCAGPRVPRLSWHCGWCAGTRCEMTWQEEGKGWRRGWRRRWQRGRSSTFAKVYLRLKILNWQWQVRKYSNFKRTQIYVLLGASLLLCVRPNTLWLDHSWHPAQTSWTFGDPTGWQWKQYIGLHRRTSLGSKNYQKLTIRHLTGQQNRMWKRGKGCPSFVLYQLILLSLLLWLFSSMFEMLLIWKVGHAMVNNIYYSTVLPHDVGSRLYTEHLSSVLQADTHSP